MTRCPSCRNEFEVDTDRCPHCNAQLPTRWLRWLAGLLAPEGGTPAAAPDLEDLLEEEEGADEQDSGRPAQQAFQDFRMTVQEVFSIPGRGVVVNGLIEAGAVRRGQKLRIEGERGLTRASVLGVEREGSLEESAQAGETVGLLLGGVAEAAVSPGRVLTS